MRKKNLVIEKTFGYSRLKSKKLQKIGITTTIYLKNAR